MKYIGATWSLASVRLDDADSLQAEAMAWSEADGIAILKQIKLPLLKHVHKNIYVKMVPCTERPNNKFIDERSCHFKRLTISGR